MPVTQIVIIVALTAICGGGGKGHAQVKVKTGSLWLSVDFERMTQMVLQDGKPTGKVRQLAQRDMA